MIQDGMEEWLPPTPPTALGDWVLLAPISEAAKVLYWLLSAHVAASNDGTDTVPGPTSARLAEVLGYRDGSELQPLLGELVAVGAVTRQRGTYAVHQVPPENYAGPKDLREFYAARGRTEQ